MNRRELVLTAGAVAMAAVVQKTASAADTPKNESKGAHLAGSASDCAAKGEACVSHCVSMLEQGDKSMGACLKAALQMSVLCRTLSTLSASGSKYAAAVSGVAMNACRECEAECRKHEKQHKICKECADACAACGAECAKTMA